MIRRRRVPPPRPAGRLRGILAYALLGVLAFAAFALALLPASVLTRAAEGASAATLRDATGTVWSGSAELAVQGEDLGRLQWRFAPAALLSGAAGVNWRLRHADFRFAGHLRYGFGGASASTSGTLGAQALRNTLAKYYIRLGGDFAFERLDLRVAPGADDGTAAWRAEGELRWSGGRTTYRLSGQSYDVEFPPLWGELRTTAEGIHLRAFARQGAGEAPLLTARLDGEGWLHVGVTRRFTRLAGKPWPGSGGEDGMVVTVAERWLGAKMAFLP